LRRLERYREDVVIAFRDRATGEPRAFDASAGNVQCDAGLTQIELHAQVPLECGPSDAARLTSWRINI